MANVNLKNVKKHDRKVSRSASAANINPAVLTTAAGVATAGTLATGDVVTLFTLPENADVTNAYIYVAKAPTGGTQTLKISVGSTDIVAAVAVGTSAGVFKGGAVTKANSGTGSNVTVTTGIANLTDGEFRIVVEYVEYNKVTGELTN